jgi:hypothetical protein
MSAYSPLHEIHAYEYGGRNPVRRARDRGRHPDDGSQAQCAEILTE